MLVYLYVVMVVVLVTLRGVVRRVVPIRCVSFLKTNIFLLLTVDLIRGGGRGGGCMPCCRARDRARM